MITRSAEATSESMKEVVTRPIVVEQPGMVSMMTLLNTVLRQRALVYSCAGILFLVVAVSGLMRDRTYTSRATFVPQGVKASGAGLGALAAQFGVNVGNPQDGLSPDFYVGLVRSRTVLGALVDSSYQLSPTSGATTTLPR